MKINNKRRIKKLNLDLDLDTIFGVYSEITSNEDVITIENMSIDFMVQNNETLDKFNEGVKTFYKTFVSRKLFRINNQNLILNKKHGFTYPTITDEGSKNTINSYFFIEESLNNWMISQIEEKINLGIPFEVLPHIIVVKDGNYLKVIFSDKILTN